MTSKRIVPVMESLSGMLLQPKGAVFPGGKADDGYIYALVVGDKGKILLMQLNYSKLHTVLLLLGY